MIICTASDELSRGFFGGLSFNIHVHQNPDLRLCFVSLNYTLILKALWMKYLCWIKLYFRTTVLFHLKSNFLLVCKWSFSAWCCEYHGIFPERFRDLLPQSDLLIDFFFFIWDTVQSRGVFFPPKVLGRVTPRGELSFSYRILVFFFVL